MADLIKKFDKPILDANGDAILDEDNLLKSFRKKQLESVYNHKYIKDLSAIHLRKGYVLLREFYPGVKELFNSLLVTETLITEAMKVMPRHGEVVISNTEDHSVGEIALNWGQSSIAFRHGDEIYCVVREDSITLKADASNMKFD